MTQNTLNWDDFEIEGNIESNNDKKVLSLVLLQTFSSNLQTAKYKDTRFSGIIWFSNFLSHFLLLLEARTRLIKFYTKYWVNQVIFLTCKCPCLLPRSNPKQQNHLYFFRYFIWECALYGLIRFSIFKKSRTTVYKNKKLK